MRRLCDESDHGESDHKVLLPLRNPRLEIARRDGSVAVALDGRRRYVLPEEDCALLPMPNTTAQRLAQHLAERVRGALAAVYRESLG